MADSINSKAKEYYDNDDSGGSLNSNLKDFLVQQGATGKSINTLWRDYAYGEGGTSLNTRLRNLWGTSGSLMKRWKETLGLTWDEVKAFFNFRDIEPDFLLDGSTSFSGSSQYIDCGTGLGDALGDNYSGDLTVSMWFKADVTNGDDGMFEIGSFTNSSTGTFVFRLKSNTISWITKWDRRIDVAYTNTSSWSHLVGVYDSRGADFTKLYLNGESIGTPTGTFPSASDIDLSGLKTTIGGYYGSPYTFDGKIANVGIWNRALSASEVESIYWRGSYSELQNTELTNLVSWYDLQGDVLDKQGSNDGTNNGATLNSDSYSGESPFKPRIQDKAAPKMAVQLADGSTSFDGADDYIDLPTSTAPTGNEITISFWEKTSAIHQNKVIEGVDSSGDTQLNIHLHYSNGVSYWDAGHDGSSYDRISKANPSGVLGQWNHWAYTKNASTGRMEVYLNGSLFMAGNGKTKPIGSLSGGTLLVGGKTSFFYDGSLANLAFFSSALTQSQIQELMFTEKYSGLPADLKTNLVSWYDLGSETLGSENVSFSSFDTDHTSSWDGFYDSLTFDTDHFNLQRSSADGRAKRALGVTLTTGKAYRVSVVAKANGSAQNIKVGVTNSAFQQTDLTIYNAGTSYDTYTHDFIADSDTTHAMIWNNSSSSNVDYQSYSIKQITLEDSEGSNDGTPVGATTNTGYTHSPHGVVDPLNFGEMYSGRALSFDGTNDKVTISSFSEPNDYSISAWFKVNTFQFSGVVEWGDEATGERRSLFLWNGGAGEYKVYSSTYGSNIAGSTSLKTGIWYHGVVTMDVSDGSATIYLNGSLDGTGTNTINPYTGTTAYIGTTGNDEFFDGEINNVKVFDTILTIDQVRELYTKPETVLPTGVSASNLKLDLPMQEGSGSYIYDGSGNQNHGTISGATWVSGQEYGYQASLVRSNTPMIFDSTDDSVNVGNAPHISKTFDDGGTVAFWVYVNSDGGANSGRILNKRVSGQGWLIHTILESGGNVTLRFMHEHSTTDGKWSITIPLFEWHHVVITYDSGSVSNDPVFYLNGVSQTVSEDATPVGSRLNDALQDLYIGNDVNTTVSFDGIINEVAIWEVALDADAVTQIYNSGVPLDLTSDSGNYDNSDSLVGYWRNDGNTTWTDRANTGVASFDSTNDYLDCGVVTDYSSASGSIATWIKVKDNASPSLQGIVTNGSTGTDSHYVGMGSNKVRYTTRNADSGHTIFADSDVPENQWVHAVATRSYDGVNTTTKLYIDGVLQADSDTYAGAQQSNSTNTLIGHLNVSRFFNGQISGTHIFNVALSASEVSELYAIDKRSSISGFSQFSNCTASWLMGADENDTASTIQDQTSNNHDATVNGAGLVGYNDGTASGSPVEILIPEGSTEGRDNQGYYLSDTTTISNGARFFQNEYILVDSSEALAKIFDGGGSVEGWIKPQSDGGGNAGRIIDKDTGSGWFLFVENESSSSVRLQFNVRFSTTDGAWQMNNNSVPINQWSHFVLTYDGSSTSNNPIIYINSSSEALTEVSTPVGSLKDDTSEDIYIGTEDGSPANGFEGLIDEIRIYDKILSADEVSKNYTNGLGKHS